MSDVIDDLSGTLVPVKPLRSAPLVLGVLAGLLLAAVYIWTFYHPRPELVALVRYGRKPDDMIVLGKPLMFLVTGLAALWAVAGLARPEGRLKLRYLLPILAVAGVALGNLITAIITGDIYPEQLGGGVVVCAVTILCGGMAGLLVLWRLWLRRSATSYPVALGAMSGLMTGSLVASAYALHCNMDAPVYIVAVYGIAVAVFTGIGALLGSRFLRW